LNREGAKDAKKRKKRFYVFIPEKAFSFAFLCALCVLSELSERAVQSLALKGYI
jgi:hypothetical protein